MSPCPMSTMRENGCRWPARWMGVGLALLAWACVQAEVELEPVIVPSEPLSVDGAVALALHNNPDVRIGRQRVLQAGELVDQAESAYWPEVQVGGRFTRTDRPAYVFSSILDQGEFDPGVDFNNPGTLSNVRPQIGAGLTLYDGGRRKALVAQSEAQLVAQLAGEEALRSTVALEVARAWYGVHSLTATLEAQHKVLEVTEQLLDLAQGELEAGALLPTEVTALRVRKAEARRAAAEREVALRKARTALRVLLGLELGRSPELSEPAAEPLEELVDLGSAWDRARLGRPEVRRAAAEIEAGIAAVDAAEAGYFPQLTLFGELGFDDAEGRLRRSNWLFGAGLLENLTDVLRTPSRVRRAASELIIAHERGRRVLLEVEAEVEAAWLDAGQADRALAVARADEQRASELLARVRSEFRVGAARRAQLLGAELEQAQARANLRVARLQAALGRVALAHAMGEFPTEAQALDTQPDANATDQRRAPAMNNEEQR